ncbi:MAG: (cytosine-5)-methyltransferase 1 [Thermoplasmata archaeon]|jgi:DNA (cytosine-5)-methyltransferase 1|nr:(cytosine-5)-methyltransferase 1 [Thermoplasmata archaeon]
MADALTVVDLFCGAGGLSKGLELYNRNGRFDGPRPKAKFEVQAGLDIYQPALDTFYRNHECPPTRFTESTDISRVSGKEIRQAAGISKVDIVVGGPPCQGFSQAGNRDAADERNALVKHFVRLVGELRPSYFVMENVPGLRKTEHTVGNSYLEWILGKFKALTYELTFSQLTAADYGVPQNRRRVVIIGSLGNGRVALPEATHAVQGDLSGKRKRLVTVGDAILDLPSPQGEGPFAYEKPAHSKYAEVMRRDSDGVYNHVRPAHTPDMVAKIAKQKPGTRLYPNFNHAWIRLHLQKQSPTVKQNNRAPAVHPVDNRVTTVRECARLQSFPDSFIFSGTKSSQLLQVGNAVPPLLARALAQAIATHACGQDAV